MAVRWAGGPVSPVIYLWANCGLTLRRKMRALVKRRGHLMVDHDIPFMYMEPCVVSGEPSAEPVSVALPPLAGNVVLEIREPEEIFWADWATANQAPWQLPQGGGVFGVSEIPLMG
ncbi:uncharacterized protein CIMG_08745 [Coccidioides immitis RS]|uniref:Uncharacterized protein n=1 Tax=Coccidioides immitis (strain RS) TaxID=246410 RepID=J3K643_COCIM|nr:uncharacterized protein CIMG_08745 [Coccidioides immitis RS]EAS29999.3 hypothetical protein CIMG_08745 [Coccidioides immitis RS]